MSTVKKRPTLKQLQEKEEDKIISKMFNIYLEDGKLKKLPYAIDSERQKWIEKYNKYNSNSTKFPAKEYPLLFLTINPKKEIDEDPTKFILQCHKATEKKWINNVIWAFEQRAKPGNEFSGIHCHMLIDRNNKRESELKREFQSTFKRFCAVENKHCLNFSFRKASERIKTIRYITDLKKDEGKQEKQENDEEFRKLYQLDPYYNRGDWFDPNNPEEDEEEEEDPDSSDPDEPIENLAEAVNKIIQQKRKPIPIPKGVGKDRFKKDALEIDSDTEIIEEE